MVGGRRHRRDRVAERRRSLAPRRAVAPRGRGRGRAVPWVRGSGPVSLAFPSAEWVSAYGTAINASAAYRAASAEWTHGPVALVVNPQPEIGIGEPFGIWLDLDRGSCRGARVVSQGEAENAAFVITGDYGRWKQVIRKELGPIAGIMQRKLTLKGSLPIVVRFVKSAEELVQAATQVPTRFLDEG
ncbi:MAG: Fis family transcriptional regulator [Gemmatimonadetes bacterium]|nr:MAG: Fis family transcriptional regulator [Gemmatimonadota bacterium]